MKTILVAMVVLCVGFSSGQSQTDRNVLDILNILRGLRTETDSGLSRISSRLQSIESQILAQRQKSNQIDAKLTSLQTNMNNLLIQFNALGSRNSGGGSNQPAQPALPAGRDVILSRDLSSCFDEMQQGNCRGLLKRACDKCRTADACARECLTIADCAGFSWVKSRNKCLLKKQVCSAFVHNQDVQFFVRKPNCGPTSNNLPDSSRGGSFSDQSGNQQQNAVTRCYDWSQGSCSLSRDSQECSGCTRQNCAARCTQLAEQCHGISLLQYNNQERCFLEKIRCTSNRRVPSVQYLAKKTACYP